MLYCRLIKQQSSDYTEFHRKTFRHRTYERPAAEEDHPVDHIYPMEYS